MPARDFLRTRTEDLAGWIGQRVLTRRVSRYRQFLDSRVVTSDQRYGFGPAFEIRETALDAPLTEPDGGVVLLDVALRSRGLGGLRDPFVEAHSESRGKTVRQYVERSIRARRYLNLSALTGATDVTLRYHDLSVDPDSARFIVAPHVDVPDPLLVLAPHPDDAELACFGLYAGRKDAWVVTASAGETGTHDYGGLFTTDTQGAILRGQMRVAESVVAPLVGGVDWHRAANLGYFDGTLADMYFRPEQAARSLTAGSEDLSLFRKANPHTLLPARSRADWQGLVQDLAHLLETSAARTVAFPHPLLEEHPDHAVLGLGALAALRESRHRPERLLAYAMHTAGGGTRSTVHPVGARDGHVSLPPYGGEQELCDGLVSVPLDTETQRKKALALDTFRDLKDPEGPLPVERIGVRVRRGLREIYRALAIYDVGLLRRCLRPNELFFVLDRARAEHWERLCAASVRERFAP